jgi:hypothetical protein
LLLSSCAPSFFPLRRPFSGWSSPGPVSMGTRRDEWTCGGVAAGSAVMLQADFWFGRSCRSWSQSLGAVTMLDQREGRQLSCQSCRTMGSQTSRSRCCGFAVC